jgi:hypothetical protein
VLGAERWILEPDARAAIVRTSRPDVATALVGATAGADGCDYRCVAVAAAPRARLRPLVESL